MPSRIIITYLSNGAKSFGCFEHGAIFEHDTSGRIVQWIAAFAVKVQEPLCRNHFIYFMFLLPNSAVVNMIIL